MADLSPPPYSGATPPEPGVDDEIRAGEIAITLPDRFDAGVYYIGRIHTPWRRRADCPRNSHQATSPCTIEVDPRYAAALSGVENCSHLLVLYWMHRARRDLVQQIPRHTGKQRGTFALRSPVRPNPIAASIVRVLAVAPPRLTVIGLDCLDGTPLIDLKPCYVADAAPDAIVGVLPPVG